MRQLILFVLPILCLTIPGCSGNFDQEGISRNEEIYRKAVEIEDWDVARMAIFNILAIDSNNHDYYDTLANLYYDSKDYPQALNSCEKALTFNENRQTTEVAFECARVLKNYEELIKYGKFLESTGDITLQQKYLLAFALVSQKNHAEAETYLKSVISDMDSETILYREFDGKGVQEVPYKACAYNLLGFIHSEIGNQDEAAKMFAKALEVHPNYIMARENLELLRPPGTVDNG